MPGISVDAGVFMMDKIITLPAPRILEKSARGGYPARHLIFLF